MKSFYKKILSKLLLLVMLLPAACSITADPEPSINALLTNRSEEGKKWKLVSYTENGHPATEPCENDDIYVFAQRSNRPNRGGVLIIDPGFLKCVIDESTVTFDWFFGGGDDHYLYIEINETGIYQYEIVEISETKLVLQNVIEHPYGDKADIIYLEFKYTR